MLTHIFTAHPCLKSYRYFQNKVLNSGPSISSNQIKFYSAEKGNPLDVSSIRDASCLLLRHSVFLKSLTLLYFLESEALKQPAWEKKSYSLPTADQPCTPASFIQPGLVQRHYIHHQIDVMARWDTQTSEHLGRCPQDLAFSHQPLGYDALSLFFCGSAGKQ